MPTSSPHQTVSAPDDLEAARARLAAAWDHAATKYVRTNATAIVAASAFGIVVLKILAVAQFNTRVAAALLGNTDSPAVVLDVALYVAPFVLAPLCLLAIGLAVQDRSMAPQVGAATRGAAVVAVVLLLLAVPLLLLVLLVLGWAILAISRWVRRRAWPNTESSSKPARPPRLLASMGEWVFVFGMLPLLVIYSPPWMPAERIGMPEGQVVVAYVVRTDGNWTVLLIDRGRSLRYVPTAEISSREPCTAEVYTFTLLELLNGPQLPQCYP
jgi:hypothetical protein